MPSMGSGRGLRVKTFAVTGTRVIAAAIAMPVPV
jgi:hypothetical protein